jgi:N-acetylglucosamine kinase-like BadF-type ATPase
MILIADSGSTKTQWRLVKSTNDFVDFYTTGLNPYHFDANEYNHTIYNALQNITDKQLVTQVFFYGAGCALPIMANRVKKSLENVFINSEVFVYTDIHGAARALFGNGSGLVAVLGTGANLGYYDGTNVIHSTPSLGYLIGDEGSGTYLGKLLLTRWLYGELPPDIVLRLESFCQLSLSEILSKIYREGSPAVFLSSFTPFIVDNATSKNISAIIEYSFEEFVKRHLLKYPQFPRQPVGVVGSVGKLLYPYLEKTINKYKGELINSIQFPLEALTQYHLNEY